MHKFKISMVLILSMLLLSSCSLGGSRTSMLNNSNDDELAEARWKEVIEALENQDKDALKAMFSEQALNEAEDFDGEMNDLFDFFQGNLDSWEKADSPGVFESNDYGHKTKEVSSYYFAYTDKQKYFFLLRDCPINTDHPENVGLYMLLVVKAEDEAKIWDGEQKILFDGKEKISHFGIYIPIK